MRSTLSTVRARSLAVNRPRVAGTSDCERTRRTDPTIIRCTGRAWQETATPDGPNRGWTTVSIMAARLCDHEHRTRDSFAQSAPLRFGSLERILVVRQNPGRAASLVQ